MVIWLINGSYLEVDDLEVEDDFNYVQGITQSHIYTVPSTSILFVEAKNSEE